MLQRVVVGLTDSASSRAALLWAAHLAENEGATIEVVTAYRDLRVAVLDPALTSCTVSLSALASMQERVVSEVLGLEAQFLTIARRVLAGDPVEVLVACADGADLLVVGRHDRSRFGLSIASRCLARADCPIAAVPVSPRRGRVRSPSGH